MESWENPYFFLLQVLFILCPHMQLVVVLISAMFIWSKKYTLEFRLCVSICKKMWLPAWPPKQFKFSFLDEMFWFVGICCINIVRNDGLTLPCSWMQKCMHICFCLSYKSVFPSSVQCSNTNIALVHSAVVKTSYKIDSQLSLSVRIKIIQEHSNSEDVGNLYC